MIKVPLKLILSVTLSRRCCDCDCERQCQRTPQTKKRPFLQTNCNHSQLQVRSWPFQWSLREFLECHRCNDFPFPTYRSLEFCMPSPRNRPSFVQTQPHLGYKLFVGLKLSFEPEISGRAILRQSANFIVWILLFNFDLERDYSIYKAYTHLQMIIVIISENFIASFQMELGV